MNAWNLDSSKIMTKQEVAAVLEDLRRRAKRSISSKLNLVIFRLATCCGLRASEIVSLQMRDAVLGQSRPVIRIDAARTKATRGTGKKQGVGRKINLWRIDPAVAADLAMWKEIRKTQGAKPSAPFVCVAMKQSSQQVTRELAKWGTDGSSVTETRTMQRCRGIGTPLSRQGVRNRFRTACRVLRDVSGPDRLDSLTVHHGRHTCASMLLAAGMSLPEVRDWMGHADISTTSVYSHVIVDEEAPPIRAFDGA